MIHLFAAMPSQGRITAAHTGICKTLAQQWQYYIVRSKNLHKVFVSVKGIYYQAIIMGETITWLAPHKFTQHIPKEVDIRVMMTFLEFYEVFVKFALFKLYGTLSLVYPPEINKALDEAGCLLYAVRARSADGGDEEADAPVNAALLKPAVAVAAPSEGSKSKLSKKQQEDLSSKLKEIASACAEEEEGPLARAMGGLAQDEFADEDERRVHEQAAGDGRTRLFSALKFFVNREVPLEWLQLCVASFGGVVGWEGPASPFGPDDPSITHHVVDRPMQLSTTLAREYVQPQWVFDSINAQFLLPAHKYRPGCSLPPHLSPFVDDDKEGYTPKYKEDIMKIASGEGVKSAAEVAAADDSESEEEETGGSRERRVEELADDEDEDMAPRKKGPKGVVYAPKLPKQTEVIEPTTFCVQTNQKGTAAPPPYRKATGVAGWGC